jgi:hypothetical protein
MNKTLCKVGQTCTFLCLFYTLSLHAEPSDTADLYTHEIYNYMGHGLAVYDMTDNTLNDIVTSNNLLGYSVWINGYGDLPTGKFGYSSSSGAYVAFECKWGELYPLEMYPEEELHIALAGDMLHIMAVFNGGLTGTWYQNYIDAFHVAWGDIIFNNVAPDAWCDFVYATRVGDIPTYGWVVHIKRNNLGTLEYYTDYDPGYVLYPPYADLKPNKLELVDVDYIPDYTEKELVYADMYGGYFVTCRQDGWGSFTFPYAHLIDIEEEITDFVLGDLNGDDYTDLIVCTENCVKTFMNTQSGGFGEVHQEIEGCYQAALGEWDYDGIPDLAVWFIPTTGDERVAIHENLDDGSGRFVSTPIWRGRIDDPPTYFKPFEFMFAELNGRGAHSLVMTGMDQSSSEGRLYVWYDDIDHAVTPVRHFNVTDSPGGHPTLSWDGNSEMDIYKYNVYRAMREDDIRPDSTEFMEIDEVIHPDTSYTDTTVLVHTQYDNYKIWYAVTAEDETSHESLFSPLIRFWGYYQEGDIITTVVLSYPEKFSLSASPNPFNPTTRIIYDLPEDSYVSMRIYNVAGQEVESLADGQRVLGTHTLSWDASHLPSGIYLAKIEAGQNHAVQKLMLIK